MTDSDELNTLMARNNLSGPQLAGMIEVDRSAVYRWRRGIKPIPRVVLLWLRLHDGVRELSKRTLAA